MRKASKVRSRITKPRPSKVMAKNVIPGDRFLLKGQDLATVVEVSTTISKKKPAKSLTCMKLQFPSGNIHDHEYPASKRILIMETPKTYKSKKALNKIKNKPNYTYI